MGEAERASKAWLNLPGSGARGGNASAPGESGGETAAPCAPPAERRAPPSREYRWQTLEDGRRVFRPLVQHADSKRSHLPAPQLSPDYAAYDCPVTGRMIEGRRAHRENLKRHDCRVLEPGETARRRRERPKEQAAVLDRAIAECAREAAKELFA